MRIALEKLENINLDLSKIEFNALNEYILILSKTIDNTLAEKFAKHGYTIKDLKSGKVALHRFVKQDSIFNPFGFIEGQYVLMVNEKAIPLIEIIEERNSVKIIDLDIQTKEAKLTHSQPLQATQIKNVGK